MEEYKKEKNLRGYELYNEIIEMWDYTYTDQKTGKIVKHPTSLKQVRKAQENIKKIDELNIDDSKLIDLTEEIRFTVQNATKRKFVGSKWIPFLCGIAVFFMIWNWLDGFFPSIKGYYPNEKAQELYQEALKNNESQLYYYSKDNPGGKKYLGPEIKREKYYKHYADELADLKSSNAKKYLQQRNSERRWSAVENLINSIVWILLFISYFYVSRPPVYLILKRERSINFFRNTEETGIMMFFAKIESILSAPTTETVTRWSDGRVQREDNAMIEIGMRIVIILVLGILIITLAMYLLPILVIVNYVRNFQIERKEKVIDWIKKKLGLRSKEFPTEESNFSNHNQVPEVSFPLVDNIAMDQYYFVRYSADGYLYFAKVIEVKDDSFLVSFYDDFIDEVKQEDICDYNYALENLRAQANWQKEGTFFSCEVLSGEEFNFLVSYDNGIEENIDISQLRFY